MKAQDHSWRSSSAQLLRLCDDVAQHIEAIATHPGYPAKALPPLVVGM